MQQFTSAQEDMTFLQMVRTDPQQIPSILDSTFYELNQKQDYQPSDQGIKQVFERYFEQCKQFLFGQINYKQAVEALQKSTSGKGVCAKTLSYGDVAWKCETCEKDPTCIICQECFEKGNHKGHKVWLKRNVSGCCDCGDPDAWEEEGFCINHKGYAASSEILLEQLPTTIKKSAPLVFSNLCKRLKKQSLILKGRKHEKQNVDNVLKEQFKSTFLIQAIFEFMDWAVEASPAFIHYITDSLNLIFIEEKIDPEWVHECCPRTFINEQESANFHQQLQKYLIENTNEYSLDEQYEYIQNYINQPNLTDEQIKYFQTQHKICTCTVLDLTFQINYMIGPHIREKVYEFYFKLFQSYKFKQILGLAFAANFEVISLKRDSKGNNLGQIGVQILTIDEISLMIMKEPLLRQNILNTYAKIIDQLVISQFAEQDVNSFYHVLYDIKYITRPKTLNYTLYETDFLECLLEQLQKLYYQDLMSFQVNHVPFDLDLYKEGLYNIDIQMTKIFKAYLKEIDPTNVERNKRLMSAFIIFFTELNNRMPSEGKKGFFVVPLHRMFSYYFTRLVMHNYFIESRNNPNKKPKEIFKFIFRKFVDIPQDQNAWHYLQNIVLIIIRPMVRSWAVTHEIMSGKWVMSGIFILQLPSLMYKVFEYYLLLYLSLFQILICVSPDSHKTIDSIIHVYEIDEWIKNLHNDLIRKNPIKSDDYEKYKPIFDEKKLRQMIHWELKLFIQLAITEIPFTYPLTSTLSKKEEAIIQNNEVNKQISKLFKNDLKREIVHSLIKSGGREDIKSLKKNSEAIYVESEDFEEALLEVADQNKDSQGKSNFKLKENYIQWYDPYYCLNPESQVKLQEVIQSMHSEKRLLNEIIGDYKGNYKFNTHVNSVIQEAIGMSTILHYIKQMLLTWKNQESMKLIDDQIAHECLKLLIIIVLTAQNLPSQQKQQFVLYFKDNDSELIKALRNFATQGGELQKTINEILVEIQKLEEAEYMDIQQKSSEVEETKESFDKKNKDQLMKEKARKRKEEIMKKFQGKRQDYIVKNVSETSSHTFKRECSSFQGSTNTEELEEIECSLCKETLSPETFYSHPYGQFAYVSKSKLMYHTLKQTLKQSNDNIKQMQMVNTISTSKQIEEEEKKNYELEEEKENNKPSVLINNLAINYLNQQHGTGGTLIKCSHFSHYSCLNNYLTTNESDKRKSEIRKLIGLDFETFQCPLCKHISNVLFPHDNLRNFHQIPKKDFHPFELIEFFTNLISKILQSQDQKSKATLPVDIRQNPIEVLRGVQKFIEHRVQLIDLKGITDFLIRHKHQVSKNEYADIMEQTRNVLNIIIEGGIKMGEEDQDMTEETFESICLSEISLIIEKHKGWQFLQRDFSSLAIQLMFYSAFVYSDDIKRQDQVLLDIVQSVYTSFKLQVLIKLKFMKIDGQLKGDANLIYNQLSLNELLKLANEKDLQEQIIQSQISFLRKIVAFVILIHSIRRNQDLQTYQIDDNFAQKLSYQVDDIEEFNLICEYLKLNPSFETIISDSDITEDKLDYKDEIIQAFIFLSSSEQLRNSLESYTLSKLVQKLNPGYEQTLIKEQILSSTIPLSIEIPDTLKLLTPYFVFKLVDLPQDFQSLVQTYYKIKCKNCGKQPKEQTVCLLCGEIQCFLLSCCQNLPGSKPHEGELSFHTRTCEGGVSLFISTTNGKIIMIENERSTSKISPYMNKFGETFTANSKRWDNFYMDKQTGGLAIYEQYQKMYMNFSIANEIIKERGMAEMVWRLRAI